jgi:hypothetical protein
MKMRSCPVCGKRMARQTTKEGSYKGLLAMHIKHKHKYLWDDDK